MDTPSRAPPALPTSAGSSAASRRRSPHDPSYRRDVPSSRDRVARVNSVGVNGCAPFHGGETGSVDVRRGSPDLLAELPEGLFPERQGFSRLPAGHGNPSPGPCARSRPCRPPRFAGSGPGRHRWRHLTGGPAGSSRPPAWSKEIGFSSAFQRLSSFPVGPEAVSVLRAHRCAPR